jgi:hypothetical protein
MEQGLPGPLWLSIPLFIILIIWSAVWKGLGLWRAARNSHLAWYICMLIFNTAGILEIVYFFGFSKPKKPETAQQNPNP